MVPFHTHTRARGLKNLLVVNKKGDREQTSEGVWKSRSNRLVCICEITVKLKSSRDKPMSHVNVIKVTKVGYQFFFLG